MNRIVVYKTPKNIEVYTSIKILLDNHPELSDISSKIYYKISKKDKPFTFGNIVIQRLVVCNPTNPILDEQSIMEITNPKVNFPGLTAKATVSKRNDRINNNIVLTPTDEQPIKKKVKFPGMLVKISKSPMTKEILQERLTWTLNQKIDHSLHIIENALSFSGNNAYVSFSGGKDSTVLLHLAKMIKPNIRTVFFNTTNEYPEIYRFVKETGCERISAETNLRTVIEKCGFPLISKEQSQYIREARNTNSEKLLDLRLDGRKGSQGKIAIKWQHLIDAPFEVSEQCCWYLKKRPAIKFEKENKLLPIIGTCVDESKLRLQKYLKHGCNAFEMRRPASYPLSIWTQWDIWDFINDNDIPYCEIYDSGAEQTGCMICGFGCHHDNRFERLQELHPKMYDIGMSYKNSGVTYKEAIDFTLRINEE